MSQMQATQGCFVPSPPQVPTVSHTVTVPHLVSATCPALGGDRKGMTSPSRYHGP